jgi:hypothetical protein
VSDIILEENKSFSESNLWRYQRDYFDQQGINAWVNQVPFYITSNPFIGYTYAEITMAYVRDLLQQGGLDKKEPLYIIELGTGSGKFSYYFLKRLKQLQKQWQLDELSLCYVMTDFTANNLQFWQQQSQLTSFVEQGMLDFAIFDLEHQSSIELINTKVTLSQGSVVNPIIVAANYIFDTISHDAFKVKQKQCYELKTKLTTHKDNIKDNDPVKLDQINTEFVPQATNLKSHYDDPVLNDVLGHYTETFKETHFLLPTGGLRAMKTMVDWSQRDLLLISTDKGYTSPLELENRLAPRVVFHGSFSMMVNFDAMGEYFIRSGGDAFHQSLRKGIKTSVFSAKTAFKALPNTADALNKHVDQFGPCDFFNIHTHIKKDIEGCDLDSVISHLRLSQWDPYIFRLFSSRLSVEASKDGVDLRTSIVENIPQLLQNMYIMPNAHNTYFDVGMFFHGLGEYRSALLYYAKADEHFPPDQNLYFNLGLCHYGLDELNESLVQFKKAVAMNGNFADAKKWMETVKKEMLSDVRSSSQ